MKTHTWLMATISMVGMLAMAPASSTEQFPNQPVKIIVPFPAGGNGDTLARMIGRDLETRWGQPIVVLNRPGGGTVIATQEVVRSASDGHTVGLVVPSLTVNPSINDSLPYDTLKDIVGISQLVTLPIGLLARPDFPAKTMSEVIALLKNGTLKASYGSAGRGSTSHLAGQLFNQMAGVEMTHVPYKGSVPAHLDLAAGRIDLMFDNVAAAIPMLKSERIRLVASAGQDRIPVYPDSPTIGEHLPGFSVESYFGMIAPAGTSMAIRSKWQAALSDILRTPEMAAWMETQGMRNVSSSPEDFDRLIEQDMKKWAGVVRSLGGKVE